MLAVILAILLTGSSLCVAADETDSSPPPLSPEQMVRVRQLVQSVQTEATLLQARLDQRQRELTDVYTAYKLDEPRADKLQAEIVELQRLLLANHHRMQVELRAIVSAERFEFLRRRLAYVAASAAAK
ncbi:MAG: periplasmic heavy metal sensor, partial [Planctomycetes bacterium]|nr:periplasmic heavy metal sensor [Planctomycetota bacterium]